jgi:hypothetical protein
MAPLSLLVMGGPLVGAAVFAFIVDVIKVAGIQPPRDRLRIPKRKRVFRVKSGKPSAEFAA